MSRILFCTFLLATVTTSGKSPNFAVDCAQSLKRSGSAAMAVGIGVLAHSLLFHVKRTSRPKVSKNTALALDIIGLGMPFVAATCAELLPQTIRNKNNNALFLGTCTNIGWMLSKIILESEA